MSKILANPYQELANAIIVQAIEDYKSALKSRDKGKQNNLKKFFHSQWFEFLTSVSPKLILSYIEWLEKISRMRMLR